MKKETIDQLFEKWEYRLQVAMNSGGSSLAEHEAEELWYLLMAMRKENKR